MMERKVEHNATNDPTGGKSLLIYGSLVRNIPEIRDISLSAVGQIIAYD